jgi:hypothetical protein
MQKPIWLRLQQVIQIGTGRTQDPIVNIHSKISIVPLNAITVKTTKGSQTS